MNIADFIISFLVLLGSVFYLVAAIGVIRFPNFLTRMHAATKAGAFGGALLLMAAMVSFASVYVVLKCLIILIFFYLTAPIAGHVLGRAGYYSIRQTDHGLKKDDLKDHNQNADE